METLVLFMMILTVWNFCLKQTFQSRWLVAGWTVAAALFTGLSWTGAAQQSRSQIDVWLADPALMLDTAVILTLEVAVQMAFCLLAARLMYAGKVRRRVVFLYRVLRWFPGVLIAGVLFAALVAALYAFPGVDFPTVSWGLAFVVLVSVPAIAWLIRWLLPERDLRLEVLFLSNALLGILGVVATVNGRTSVAATGSVDWLALLAFAALILVFGAIGWLRFNRTKTVSTLNK